MNRPIDQSLLATPHHDDDDLNPSDNPSFMSVLDTRLSRRGVLRGGMGTAAAAVSFSPSAPDTGGGGGGGCTAGLPPSLPPPQPTSMAAARIIAPQTIVERVICCSITSWDSARRPSWR